jgi:hypothetical protein
MESNRDSIAHVLFEKLKNNADPLGAIRALISPQSPTFEDDHLDFKTTFDQGKGIPLADEKIKEMWSEALGGFANTGGGLIVWGIDARKVNGVDAAMKEILVPDVFAFQTKLKEWARNANDSPVADVEYAAFKAIGDEGFLLCLIPQSNHSPHNSEFIKNKPYIMRVGDSFIKIGPAQLRRMFYPQFCPDLKYSVKCSNNQHPAILDAFSVSLELSVENIGRGSAKDLFVVVKMRCDKRHEPQPTGLGNGDWEYRHPSAVSPGFLLKGFKCKSSLHPQLFSFIHNLTLKVHAITGLEIEIIVESYAENLAPSFYRGLIDSSAILDQRSIQLELV